MRHTARFARFIPAAAAMVGIVTLAGVVLSQQPAAREAVRIVFNDGSVQEIAQATPAHSIPTTPGRPGAPVRSRVGVNLDSTFTYSPQDAFIDAMKNANRFGSWETPHDKKAPTDALGWPTSPRSGVVVFVQRDPADVQGTYKLIVEGRTIPSVTNSGKSTVTDVAYDPATNRTTASVNVVGGNLWLRFEGPAAGNGAAGNGAAIKVKLLRPGYDSDEKVFTDAFLAMLRPDPATGTFGGVRFMDWNGTNNSTVTGWDTRRKIESATYSGEVPLEHQIALCNKLKADGWFCIPHQASDEYIASFKQLIEQTLDPDLECIVEYSNEVWNWIFKQAKWNLDEAKRRGGEGDAKLTMNGSQKNDGYWAQFLYADQVVRLKKALGPRFKVVLAGHYGYGKTEKEYAYWGKKQLEYIQKTYGNPADYVDALAVAPYYGVGQLATTRPISVDEYVGALERGAGTTASSRMDAWVNLARSINRPLWAYEAGTHDVKPKSNPDGTNAVLLAQRDPRIGRSVERYANNFFDRGGERLFWFVACARNTNEYTWGATWSPRATDAPKYAALRKVAATRPVR